MKISVDWLKDYIDLDLSAEQIAETLSDLGFPCEGIERLDGDTVIDIEVTSNRGDCLGIIGVARELRAVTGKELTLPDTTLKHSRTDVEELITIGIGEPDLCSRYTGRVIEGVKVRPSPNWLVKRLKAVGLRTVNNVVDATNYAMLETGQPSHAFDYEKIAGQKIMVRKAVPGERLVTIDGTKCELDAEMLVIADADKAIALAGVMGGLDSEVSESTSTVFLEVAYFDPVTVRRTSRKLVMPSEAAFRFERIVDIDSVEWASRRTACLINLVAGGKVAKGIADVYPQKPNEKSVSLRSERLRKVLGIDIPDEKAEQILTRLGFDVEKQQGVFNCRVPSWRSDVYREADLIEEVGRVHGYNRIPTEQKLSIGITPPDSRQKLTQLLSDFLNGCGFFETINITFTDDRTASVFGSKDPNQALRVKDVSRKSVNILRQSLIGSLLGVLKTNLNAKNQPCRIFELADTFVPDPKRALPIEKTKLALVCDCDLRELRGVIEAMIDKLDRSAQLTFEPAEIPWAQAGANIILNGKTVGAAGIAGEDARRKFDFKEVTPAAAEIEFEHLLKTWNTEIKVQPVPRFPAIARDLSVVVDEKVAWADISQAVEKNAPDVLEDIKFVEIYRGKAVSGGKKSITLSLRFRDEDGTLTHDKVDGFEKIIVNGLAEATGAQLRKA